ncbi:MULTISPECIES: NAD(P)H-hydrate dehydratase [Methylobacterium]|jgi:ADP-dependent NAD(P)H-hydrate dehydratase|uniref:ADP-dependent (S)-NAD(P)H-hydrate dehydratase n=2 Tax=Methylobacterium TaxID=407 RepID=A0A0C6FSV9_9HYPH|nr:MULTISPECIES: NAD(P)H-hydrate dehydratase [Methylobacterium]MBZ6415339.1 NAD(P)H-hydrate dehydratase [Methylobacterium sp.]MBK3397616.1 NAD(P)H-hydrate dehydratase [Methylobacterium ajmalii]MBK3407634.1 NAD(P)H-hydrate dehydratase [Methylobacterium ajmalii]SFF68325.1 yjeF C-terminal region, hydroxyethylthiazole kinase-related [Methylobacterium sp. yr596]BAQ48594.1 carbohydrate kinase [Methylobacterium aquaticum]
MTIEIQAASLRGYPLPDPGAGTKEARGSALVVAGSVEVPGAAILAGTAALRAGAGKLQMSIAAGTAPHAALAVPEALVVRLPEGADGHVDHRVAAEVLLPRTERAAAILVGAGMTAGAPTRALTAALLAGPAEAPFVLDAASIEGLCEQAEAVRARAGRVVLTPHAGEMARCLGCDREAVEADPLAAARKAAEQLGAVVVMKGAETWIVDPAGETWHYAGGGVGLATSGSGDVLAGIIVGLLARGTAPAEAAAWGVFLHGEAGRRLGESRGPIGFLARELPGEVPGLMRDVADGTL